MKSPNTGLFRGASGIGSGLGFLRACAPGICFTPKSFLAAVLSVSCLTLGIDFSAFGYTANPADKRPKQDPILKGLPVTDLTPDEAILHALNRLAYGPRPGDVERIKQMGLAKWIEQQLNPKSIDDSAVDARLNEYPTLAMSSAQLIYEYPQPKQAAKAEAKAAAQNQEGSAKPGDAAAAVMRQDIESGNAAATAKSQQGSNNTDGGGVQMDAAADTPPPMKLNPATKGAGKKDVLGV